MRSVEQGYMDMMNLPPVWRTPAGMSQSPAQYAQSQGRNWSQTVNNPQMMQGYYGGNDDYSGGRYVPPTYRMGYDSSGNIDPNAMQWNTQRDYYTPQQNYRFPTMPNFGMMEGMGNFGMNPFQQMMQMQQMGWMMGGRGGPWAGMGQGAYRPQMPMFGGNMMSPYFGYGGLGGWFGQGQQVPGLGPQQQQRPPNGGHGTQGGGGARNQTAAPTGLPPVNTITPMGG